MWTGESGYFRIRRRSKFVSSLLLNNKLIWRHNRNNIHDYHICFYYSALLWRKLWTHFIAEEFWVLEWLRIPSDTWRTVNLNLNTLRVEMVVQNVTTVTDGDVSRPFASSLWTKKIFNAVLWRGTDRDDPSQPRRMVTFRDWREELMLLIRLERFI